MDGHPRQNPAYRPANEKPRFGGASPFRAYLTMLTARAATSRTVTAEIADSQSIRSFARWLSGIASVGLKAIEFVNERYM